MEGFYKFLKRVRDFYDKIVKILSDYFYKILLTCVIVIVTIGFIAIPIYFFCIHTKAEAEALDDHRLKVNEKMIAAIDSLDSNSIALDSVQLRQEVMQVKKMTKYLIERETNYQMEIDLIIDKYSHWTGYWLSVISVVLTLFTIIQALLNHRMSNENEKTIKEIQEENKEFYHRMSNENERTIKEIQEEAEKSHARMSNENEKTIKEIQEENKEFYHQISSESKEAIKKIQEEAEKSHARMKNENEKTIKGLEKSFNDTTKDFVSSLYQNRLSCISACLSTFPDAFSFSPNEERKRFVQTFMRMLHTEYSEYVSRMTECISKEETYCPEEIRYIYLIWCDISIAINKVSFDYDEIQQTVAFEDLKESLSTAIIMFHKGEITSANVAEYMKSVQENIESIVNII